MKIIKCKSGNILMTLKEVNNVDDKVIKANDVDAAFEKHIPTATKLDNNKVEIRVNHVMEEKHYIEWILIDYGNKQIIQHFKPNDEPAIIVEYQNNMKAYSYCNLHSLWLNDKI